MPVSPQPSRLSKYLALLKSRSVIAGFVWALIGVSILYWPHFRHTGPLAQPSVAIAAKQTPVPQCAAPMPSFCETQAEFIQSMQTRDAAGSLVEAQNPIRVNCKTVKIHGEGGCNSAGGNFSVQVYPVKENGSVVYYMRNGYIAYFNDFFNIYGPFRFSGSSGSNVITMAFKGTQSSASFNLTFKLTAGTWQLQMPIIN